MNRYDRYTDEQLVERLWAVEEIKKLVYKRGYYVTNEWRQQELDDLWVQDETLKKTASFGRNIGWYVGIDAIKEYYVSKHLKDREKQLKAICAVDPSVKYSEGNLSLGCLSHHPATTGVVELSGDGQSAKGIFYSIAQETTALPDGTAEALWVPEKQAYDFIRENGQWKIWHIMIATDLVCEAGDSFENHSPYAEYETDPVMLEFGAPTIPCICHDTTFNWWDNYPPVPKPYETFSDEISYGPEGYRSPELFAWGAREGGNFR